MSCEHCDNKGWLLYNFDNLVIGEVSSLFLFILFHRKYKPEKILFLFQLMHFKWLQDWSGNFRSGFSFLQILDLAYNRSNSNQRQNQSLQYRILEVFAHFSQFNLTECPICNSLLPFDIFIKLLNNNTVLILINRIISNKILISTTILWKNSYF
jgi:hypothetical protein